MYKTLFLSLALVVVVGLVSTDFVYAHDPSYYKNEDVKVEAKKIDKGVNVTVTSDDPETAEYIQTHIPWYEKIFRKISHFGHTMTGHGGMMRGHEGMNYADCPMM